MELVVALVVVGVGVLLVLAGVVFPFWITSPRRREGLTRAQRKFNDDQFEARYGIRPK